MKIISRKGHYLIYPNLAERLSLYQDCIASAKTAAEEKQIAKSFDSMFNMRDDISKYLADCSYHSGNEFVLLDALKAPMSSLKRSKDELAYAVNIELLNYRQRDESPYPKNGGWATLSSDDR